MRKVCLISIFLSFICLQVSAQEKPRINKHGVVCNGSAIYLPKPEFSEELKEKVRKTSVYIKVIIDEKGNVISAEAVTGNPLLHREAEKAALKAKFRVNPPVYSNCGIVYNFDFLKNNSAENKKDEENFSPSIEITKCYKCDDIVISLPSPKYPKYVGTGPHVYNGEVAVQIVIDKQGNIKSVKGVSGHPYFRSILERETLKAKFKPRIISGKPIETSVVIVYKITSTKPIVINHFPPNTEPIFEPKPEYPKAARLINVAGKVVVSILVNEKGIVEKAEIVSGHPLLHKEAIKAAQKTKFPPQTIGGSPVKVRSTIVYDFKP